MNLEIINHIGEYILKNNKNHQKVGHDILIGLNSVYFKEIIIFPFQLDIGPGLFLKYFELDNLI